MTRLIVHAGAGNPLADSDIATIEPELRAGIASALELGHSMLMAGHSSLDVVTEVVVHLEDCELFNAGRGSVLTKDGTIEMDAAVMDGRTLRAGAVACVKRIRNPVRGARAIMDAQGPVLIVGPAADEFAAREGCELAPPDYFLTPYWKERWLQSKDAAPMLDHTASASRDKHGTVGAVALDMNSHLAAATSTGGLLNKTPGRVSDSAIPGAGTYASDRSVAVSFTGTGEHIIRTSAARSLASLMENAGLTPDEAADRVMSEFSGLGGEGGFVAIDADRNYLIRANTAALLRGWLRSDGTVETGIYMAATV